MAISPFVEAVANLTGSKGDQRWIDAVEGGSSPWRRLMPLLRVVHADVVRTTGRKVSTKVATGRRHKSSRGIRRLAAVAMIRLIGESCAGRLHLALTDTGRHRCRTGMNRIA